ncbi:MAG: hypothetical protein K2K25_06595 [Muribaculaceae bacterium]|nr:hypothetical protein [Muribaculaceae bacterium]
MKKFTLMCAAVAAALGMSAQTPLTAEMWHKWTGWGADATVIEDAETGCEYNVGKELGQGDMVVGPQSCNGDLYADLSEYAGIEGVATPGITMRFYLNRVDLQGPGTDIKVNTDEEGKFSFIFSDYSELADAEFVHLNFIKIAAGWQGGAWPDGLDKAVVESIDLISNEVPIAASDITAEWWHKWTGWNADATVIEDAETGCEYNVGKELGQGDMVIGPQSCNGDLYADLSAYAGIEGVATPGITMRFYLNRVDLQGPGTDIKINTDEEGKFSFIFSEYSELANAGFVHLNFIKIAAGWQGGIWPDGLEKAVVTEVTAISGGSGVTSITNTKAANDVIYNLYGQPVDENYRGIVIKNGKKYINK